MTGNRTSERLEELKQLGAEVGIGKPLDFLRLIATRRTPPRGG